MDQEKQEPVSQLSKDASKEASTSVSQEVFPASEGESENAGLDAELMAKLKNAELTEQIEILSTVYDDLVAELQSSDKAQGGAA